MAKTINTIGMNDMESMMKKSESDGEELDDDEELDDEDEENSSTSVSNENGLCFQTGGEKTIMTSKSLLGPDRPTELSQQVDAAPIRMPAQLKRNYASICLFAFLVGTDFAVIIPTLWERLSIDYGASGAFMGFVISSYSLTGVVCGLVMGSISDATKNKTKLFLLVSIMFGIAGHTVYFVSMNERLVLLARSISGLCLGATTVLLAYIAKTSNERQRTAVISLVMASRQLGLMFGPAFNIFLRKLNFYLFDWILVDSKSAPGAFMALLWTVCLLLVAILFKEFYPSSSCPESPSSSRLSGSNQDQQQKFSRKNKNIYKKEFLRVEIFVLLGVTFFTYFNQTSLETIVIPFTEVMFGWNELENSILFCIGGLVIIASYVGLRVLSRRLADRSIILIGLLSIVTGLIIACACLPFAPQFSSNNVRMFLRHAREEAAEKRSLRKWQTSFIPDEYAEDELSENSGKITNFTRPLLNINTTNSSSATWTPNHDYQLFPAFVMFVVLDVLGLPAIAICSASLFTKLIDNKVQGIGQGIQRGVLGLGTILGPLLAGPLIYKPVILFAVTLCFALFILLFLLVFFRLFRMPAASSTHTSTTTTTTTNRLLKT